VLVYQLFWIIRWYHIQSRTTILEPSASEVEVTIENLKSNKSPGIDQIPVALIKAWGRKIHSEIHKLLISIWNKEELPEEWKELTYKKGNKTDCSNHRGISLLPTTYKLLSCSQG
jgi:hypothetical protein